MPNRSKEEMRFASYMMKGLGLEIDAAFVIRSLKEGSKDGMWDQKIELSSRVLYIDWDSGYYHGQGRVAYDTKKTVKILEARHDAVALRVRVKDAPPLDLTHPRACIVHVPNADPAKALFAVAQA